MGTTTTSKQGTGGTVLPPRDSRNDEPPLYVALGVRGRRRPLIYTERPAIVRGLLVVMGALVDGSWPQPRVHLQTPGVEKEAVNG
jgi:hypothetical protein